MYIEAGEASAYKSADRVEKISSCCVAQVVDYDNRSRLLQSASVNLGVQSMTMKPEKNSEEKIPLTKSGRIFIVEKSSSTSGDFNDGREMREDNALRSVVSDEPGEEDMLDRGERPENGEDDTAAKMMEEDTDGCQADSFDSENEEETEVIFGSKLKSIFICKTGNGASAVSSSRGKDLPLRNPIDGVVRKSEKRPSKLRKKRAISFVDTMISFFVVAPLVIGQWRGIWNMMDIYNEFFPEWLCFILGSGLHVVFAITRNGFHGRFVENWRTYGTCGRVAYDLVRLVYIYVFCVACNGQWRGGWMIFSHYLGSNVWVVSFFTVLFITGLVILRSFRNLLAPPFIVVIDRPDRVFQFPTRYNVYFENDLRIRDRRMKKYIFLKFLLLSCL